MVRLTGPRETWNYAYDGDTHTGREKERGGENSKLNGMDGSTDIRDTHAQQKRLRTRPTPRS